ncbi:hypothetical protein Slin14017_G019080 [Septoria linicola]|nr:hypothetical protein Slin14017_G019080 [Septoria linicola]
MFASKILALLAACSTLALANPILEKRATSCLRVGASATARWTNAAGQTCTWTGTVGSNFGSNSANGGDYGCNGRCGASCSGASIGNAYTQDCFSHDICSWFENASGGASDANCGAAFNSAIDDTALGVANGCGQTNPSNSVSPPSSRPQCS